MYDPNFAELNIGFNVIIEKQFNALQNEVLIVARPVLVAHSKHSKAACKTFHFNRNCMIFYYKFSLNQLLHNPIL